MTTRQSSPRVPSPTTTRRRQVSLEEDEDDEALYHALAATSQLTPPQPEVLQRSPASDGLRESSNIAEDLPERSRRNQMTTMRAEEDDPEGRNGKELYLGILDTQGAEVVQVPDVSSVSQRIANVPASSSRIKKRDRSSDSEGEEHGNGEEDAAAGEDDHQSQQAKSYMETDAYKPSAFGDFRSYMKNKRLKLKVQEAAITEDEARASAAGGTTSAALSDRYPPLFKGTCIYINGHTIPPYAELRRILQLHGGELMPYLDQKTPVTHIVASNLTAKKRIEFERYKVVKPEWVVKSVEEGRRLDWSDFRCDADATGAMQAGALVPREAVGARKRTRSMTKAVDDEAPLESNDGGGEEDEEDKEKSKRIPMGQDWRSLKASENPAALFYRPSGAGAGSNDSSVGPWGRSSRQKTLKGWAEKASDLQKSVEPPSAKAQGEVQTRSPSPAEKTLLKRSSTSAEPRDSKCSRDEDVSKGQEGLPDPLGEAKPIHRSPERNSKSPAEASSREKDEDDHESVQTSDAKTFPSLGTDPPTVAAAIAAGLHHPSHPYAKHPSNRKAAELLLSPSWRQHNTATGDSFLAGFFEKSRLHHLSTWKSEMKELVTQAMRDAGREQGSLDLPAGIKRCIMHVDFDAFFVTVGLRKRPDLVDKPVVVCHNSSDTAGESSTSEIASCSYEARKSGIRNGMSLGQARRMCPAVQTIPYDFAGYNDVAVKFYSLMLEHADALEAVSIDEALLDVSMLLHNMRRGEGLSEPGEALLRAYRGHTSSQGELWTEEKQLAEALRDEIRARTGCEASIGIGANVLQARLATRKAKPGGSFHLKPEEVLDFTANLDVDDLHGIGWSMRNRFKELFGTYNVGLVRTKATKARLTAELGEKMGATVWDKLHGRERGRIEAVKQRQSCGANVNYAIRFETQDEAKDFVRKLCDEVSSRLRAIRLVGRQCVVNVMIRAAHAPVEAPKFLGHGPCDTHSRSCPIRGPGGTAVDDAETIFKAAWPLVKSLNAPPDQLRGLGVTLQKLEPTQGKPVQRPEAGQSRLMFHQPQASTFSRKHTDEIPVSDAFVLSRNDGNVDAKARTVDFDLGESKKDNEDERNENNESLSETLVPGPSFERARQRSITPEPTTRPPPMTQFVVPPLSQLDSEVVAALPAHIKAQIDAARSRQGASTSRSVETTKHDESHEVALMTSPAKATSTTTTPTKVNPFTTLMKRAASATPTKRDREHSTLSQKKLLQQQAAAEARSDFVAETFSQIDPAVLQELPESMRKEIMREYDRGKDASLSPLDNKRSLSESPRKSRGGLLQQQRLFEKAVLNETAGKHQMQQGLPAAGRLRAMELATSTSMHGHSTTLASPSAASRIRDPATVTREELRDLGIDADFYAALPHEVQAEMLSEQRSRVARFKGGKQAREKTVLEERRMAMEVASRTSGTAALLPLELQQQQQLGWEPLLQAVPSKEGPSLKGATTLDEIRRMIRAWYQRYGTVGPRMADVAKFRQFLQSCDNLMTSQVLTYLKRITIAGDAVAWTQLIDEVANERKLKFG